MTAGLERTDAARFKIEQLLTLVRAGQVRVPRFQRGLKWSATDVERLFDSIYKGFPIGTLLFWERSADAGTVDMGPIHIEAPDVVDALWVVDGQQRVTSLAAALLPENEAGSDPRFDLAFDLASERFLPLRGNEDRETRIPLRSAYDLQRVLSWLRERQLPEEMQDRAFRLADRLRNYEVPAYIVKAQDEDALRQIFDRTNTFGKRMTRAEVFHALHTSTTERTSDLRALAEEVSSMGFGEFDDNTLLFCVLAMRDADVLRDFHSEFDRTEDLATVFRNARFAIGRAIDFLQTEADVPHLDLVAYQHLTVGLVRFFALHPAAGSWQRILLRRWYWRSSVHGPIARLGSTGTLRATTKAISEADATASVLALLDSVPDEPRTPEVGPYRWNVADTRVIASALASLHPVDLLSGEPINSNESINVLGREALVRIVDRRVANDLVRSLANRVFSHPDGLAGTSGAETLVEVADPARLKSHAITPEAVAALRQDNIDDFLELRRRAVTEVTSAFVAGRAEWERPGRPPIEELTLVTPDA